MKKAIVPIANLLACYEASREAQESGSIHDNLYGVHVAAMDGKIVLEGASDHIAVRTFQEVDDHCTADAGFDVLVPNSLLNRLRGSVESLPSSHPVSIEDEADSVSIRVAIYGVEAELSAKKPTNPFPFPAAKLERYFGAARQSVPIERVGMNADFLSRLQASANLCRQTVLDGSLRLKFFGEDGAILVSAGMPGRWIGLLMPVYSATGFPKDFQPMPAETKSPEGCE